ncbi:MAG: hypothetical protein AABM40_04280 [Chloroflexota bacterium]
MARKKTSKRRSIGESAVRPASAAAPGLPSQSEDELDDLDALAPPAESDADRMLKKLLEKGSQSSTGVEDIANSVRRLRALP